MCAVTMNRFTSKIIMIGLLVLLSEVKAGPLLISSDGWKPSSDDFIAKLQRASSSNLETYTSTYKQGMDQPNNRAARLIHNFSDIKPVYEPQDELIYIDLPKYRQLLAQAEEKLYVKTFSDGNVFGFPSTGDLYSNIKKGTIKENNFNKSAEEILHMTPKADGKYGSTFIIQSRHGVNAGGRSAHYKRAEGHYGDTAENRPPKPNRQNVNVGFLYSNYTPDCESNRLDASVSEPKIGYRDPKCVNDVEKGLYEKKVDTIPETNTQNHDKTVTDSTKYIHEKLFNNKSQFQFYFHHDSPPVRNNSYDKTKVTGVQMKLMPAETKVYPQAMLHAKEKINVLSLKEKLQKVFDRNNIRFNDRIANYGISRQKKSVTGNFLNNPSSLEIKSYNSPNHVPVDPIISVFLSHYGYYIPGTNGIVNNFRNLYGYLASNSIHNNKPFDIYKHFSD